MSQVVRATDHPETRAVADPATADTGHRAPWRWQHHLSIVGCLFLVWGAWTVTAWLLAGPHSITEYRDPDSEAFAIAKVYEVAIVAVSIAVTFHVIRGVLRERRFTFDAQLCVAGALAFWIDPFYNFFVPSVAYSSNFVNVGSWCSYAPLVVNKNCGANPEPVFIGLSYCFGFLACAMLGCSVLRFLERRAPRMSMTKRLAICGTVGMIFDIPFDVLPPRLNLWNEFSPDALYLWGPEHRYPLWMVPAAVIFFGAPVAARYFRDDRGRTVFERGLDHLGARRRAALSFLALVSFMQVVVATAVFSLAPMGVYATDSPDYPRHIVNGQCDVGSNHGSPYGPCPGTPAFNAPIRHLPGHD